MNIPLVSRSLTVNQNLLGNGEHTQSLSPLTSRRTIRNGCGVETPEAEHQQKEKQNNRIAGFRHVSVGSAYSSEKLERKVLLV